MPADDKRTAPAGHDTTAHRTIGWCSLCGGHDMPEGLVVWRARESAARYAREERRKVDAAMREAQSRGDFGPNINLASVDGQPCPVCGADELTVVTVTAYVEVQERTAGGWAMCFACNALPHPVMEADHG